MPPLSVPGCGVCDSRVVRLERISFPRRLGRAARHGTFAGKGGRDARSGNADEQSAPRDQRADSVATPLFTAINERNFWPSLLKSSTRACPKQDIWITELIPTSGGKPVGLSEAERAKITSAASPTPSPLSTAPNKLAAEPVIDGVLCAGFIFSTRRSSSDRLSETTTELNRLQNLNPFRTRPICRQ